MNNDIIGKEVVFYENNTWNHIIKEINLYTYTIEYGIKSGFSDKEQAEQSYFFFVSAKYCYITHELRLHQNDRCKRFTPV
ncbi:MAG: hypothetical protein U0O23_05900 [Mediterraneibacter gnavus]